MASGKRKLHGGSNQRKEKSCEELYLVGTAHRTSGIKFNPKHSDEHYAIGTLKTRHSDGSTRLSCLFCAVVGQVE